MKKNKNLQANVVLILICLLLNMVCYYAILKINESWIYISILALVPLGSIISSMIGGRVPGILTTVFSTISFYIIDKASNAPVMTDLRIIAIALATTLICSVLQCNNKRQKLFFNVLIILLISLVNIVVNLGYWKYVYGLYYSIFRDIYIITLVPLIAETLIVLACFFATKGYKAKFISCFNNDAALSSKNKVQFPIGAKITVAISIVSISLVTIALLNNSKTYYDRIAHTMDLEVIETAGNIVAPYNPGDIVFSEAWEREPEVEKERLTFQIADAIENSKNANYITKAELVKTETDELDNVISAKIIGTFYPYDPNEGYLGASGIRYDATEKAVNLKELMFGDVHGWTFESDFFFFMFLDDNYFLRLHMKCMDVDGIPAYVFKQIILSLVVAMLVGSFAVTVLEIAISSPLKKMTYAAEAVIKVDEKQREKAVREFSRLDICSHDEVANLYRSFGKAMADMNQYASDVKEQADHITQIQQNIIIIMADIVESRDQNTGGHIQRTAKYVEIIARELAKEGRFSNKLTEKYIEDMVVAAPLHDIGKIYVSDTILNKPAKLDFKEYNTMKNHANAGRQMLEKAKDRLGKFEYLEIAIQMAGMHHEWWDGTGYPNGLQGEEIAICARIMAVSDVFDAILSKRCYKDAVEFDKAFDMVVSESGSHFDPVVIEAFIAAKEELRNASV